MDVKSLSAQLKGKKGSCFFAWKHNQVRFYLTAIRKLWSSASRPEIFSPLTRNLYSKGVAADANEVVGHALDCHPATGQPHSKDALHLHGPVLPSLHLHCGSLERDGHLQPSLMSVAPAPQVTCSQSRQKVGEEQAPCTTSFRGILHFATYVGRIPKHWYQMILGAGYPNEVQVSVVIFSHLTTATGLSASDREMEWSLWWLQSLRDRPVNRHGEVTNL